MSNATNFLSGFQVGQSIVEGFLERKLQSKKIAQEKAKMEFEQAMQKREAQRGATAFSALEKFKQGLSGLDDQSPDFPDRYRELYMQHAPDIGMSPQVNKSFEVLDKTIREKVAFDTERNNRLITQTAALQRAKDIAEYVRSNPLEPEPDPNSPQDLERVSAWKLSQEDREFDKKLGQARRMEEMKSEFNTSSRSETEAQSNSRVFAARMEHFEGIIDKVDQAGFNPTGFRANFFPHFFQSSEGKQYLDARKGWVAAVLRKESGAAISESEYESAYDVYFPKFGDSPENIAQKKELRKLAQREMEKGAGAYGVNGQKVFSGNAQGVEGSATETPRFSTVDDLEKAGAMGLIKPGQAVIVNGQHGVYEAPGGKQEEEVQEDDQVPLDEVQEVEAEIATLEEQLAQLKADVGPSGGLGPPGLRGQGKPKDMVGIRIRERRLEQLKQKLNKLSGQ